MVKMNGDTVKPPNDGHVGPVGHGVLNNGSELPSGAKEVFDTLLEMSNILDTGLTCEGLAICHRLIETGVGAESLAKCVVSLRAEGQNNTNLGSRSSQEKK